MNSEKKGRAKFTSAELATLRKLIIQKCEASPSQQKSIRSKMRTKGFYITDFVDDITSVEEFDQLVDSGKIICIDDQYVPSNEAIVTSSSKNQISLKKSVEKGNIKEGLAAVVGDKPRVLILGTLPGDESLNRQEYYAKAGNRFWKIIYGLYGKEEIPAEYEERIAFLKDNNIAIWDVLSGAVRDGSLDSNIEQGTPNDIPDFLKKYPTVEVIAFNGKKAEKIFNEYFPQLLNPNKWKMLTLLSSSGANNQFSLDQMKKDWGRILK
ncbi:MAG: DNA-deoxyinosine glycosylase [Muribaculaceae bacterium]|nr:DNA-deoxyinosine glycosylase [Muribaculaceae bacterium]MDE6769321.1 DNA-deoxyinosine glycosylase [Muribaculaceae bacterium]